MQRCCSDAMHACIQSMAHSTIFSYAWKTRNHRFFVRCPAAVRVTSRPPLPELSYINSSSSLSACVWCARLPTINKMHAVKWLCLCMCAHIKRGKAYRTSRLTSWGRRCCNVGTGSDRTASFAPMHSQHKTPRARNMIYDQTLQRLAFDRVRVCRKATVCARDWRPHRL